MPTDKNIPKGYFWRKPKEIIDAVHQLEDDIKTQAPILYSIGKEEPYNIPEGYFEGFYKSLDTSGVKVFYLQPAFRYMAAACLTIAIMSLGWLWLQPTDPNYTDEMAMSDVYEYYIDNIDEIDESLIIDLSYEYADILDLEVDYTTDGDLDVIEESILNEMTDQEFLDFL